METDARFRKSDWANRPEQHFAVLTFADLGVEDKFIRLPTPGENKGYAGLKGTFHLFVKTSQQCSQLCDVPRLTGKEGSLGRLNKVICRFPSNMPVVRIG